MESFCSPLWFFNVHFLERQSHCEVEGIVATEARMQQGIVFGLVVLVGWIDSLHAEVEAQDEITEVETHAQTVADGQLTGEVLQTELSAGLNVIRSQSPDITSIDKGCSIEFPE